MLFYKYGIFSSKSENDVAEAATLDMESKTEGLNSDRIRSSIWEGMVPKSS